MLNVWTAEHTDDFDWGIRETIPERPNYSELIAVGMTETDAKAACAAVAYVRQMAFFQEPNTDHPDEELAAFARMIEKAQKVAGFGPGLVK
jgi:uncharacterized protein YecE (DUF72 family)